MSKTLLEQAADILSRSKASAPKEPMHKAEGEVQDLGGVTPTKAEPESAPVTKDVKKATAPGKPAPVGQMPMEKIKEEKEEDEKDDDEKDEKDEKDDEKDEKDDKDMKEAWDKKMKEDVDAILSSESNLSESFREKISTIYEARITDKANQIREELTEQFTQELTEAVTQLESQLEDKIDSFLSYVVEEWMEENALAIESGLRTELTEDFIAGLRNLFAEHYITVPDDKVDLVDELANKIEVLENELNETVSRNVEMKKQLVEATKKQIVSQVCEGLTQTQTEKIHSLVESADFTSESDFQKKVETLRENYFSTTVKAVAPSTLTEQVDIQEMPEVRGAMEQYMKAISKTLPK